VPRAIPPGRAWPNGGRRRSTEPSRVRSRAALCHNRDVPHTLTLAPQGVVLAIYSVDSLIAKARRIAADYRRATGKAMAGVSGEIALHDAARLLDLELVKEGPGGYDAVGRGSREGQRVQIKSRVIFDEGKSGQRIGQLKVEKAWDLLLLVLLDADYEPFEIWEADRAEVDEALAESSSRKNRGAISVARFRHIARLVWTQEEGAIEDELWENRHE